MRGGLYVAVGTPQSTASVQTPARGAAGAGIAGRVLTSKGERDARPMLAGLSAANPAIRQSLLQVSHPSVGELGVDQGQRFELG